MGAGIMKIVCAWCLRDLGKKPGPEGKMSHGMCDQCREKIEREMEETCNIIVTKG